jgi:hypothetical protein
LTAKSAGSGALTRANSVFNTTTNNNNNNNNNKQRATKVNTRHSSDDKTKPSSRPHSPPTKRNESPAILNEKEAAKKPTILDESKKNIINEDKSKKPSVHDSKKPEDKSKKVEERLTKKEVEKKQHEEEEKQIPSVSTSSSSSISSIQFHHNSYQQQEKENPPVSITELISKVMAQEEQTQHYEQGEYEHEESRLDHDSGIIKEYQTSPLLSPPSTPAAVPPCQYSAASENEYVTKKGEEGEYFDEEFEEVEDDEGEEEQQHYYHNNHYYQQSNHNQYQQQQQQQQNRSGVLIHSEPVSPTLYTFDAQSVQPRPYEIDKVQQPSFVQPIQRIQRLRPAASFATLRQLANHNGSTGQLNQLKRRPVSFIESTAATTTHASASVAEDYLTVRPVYSRRASHEDQSHHIRQQSDNVLHHRLSSPPSVPSSRRLVRSNTVQNVIIKDGQGHRIVQYLGPTSPPLQPQLRRKKIASFESHDSFFSDSTASSNNGWTRRQNEYEQVYQPVFDDTSSSDSGSQRCKRRIKRRDSARSLNHGFESAKCEQLQNKLEKERATVKVLQKQKEGKEKKKKK